MQSDIKETGGFFGNRKLVRALVVSLIFFCVQFVLVHYHELWTDEVHAWEIVRCSHSFHELLFNTRYEGHPQVWFMILYFLQKITVSYFAMQVVHVFIASCTVFVFCFFSPFKLWQNILFCAGYFFSYEYSIISRNYAIEVFMLFLCAGVYTRYHGKNLVVLSILFFLFFQTNVLAIVIGLSFFTYILWNIYEKDKTNIKRFFVPVIIIIAGIITAGVTTLPPADTAFAGWNIKPDAHGFIRVLSRSFITYFPFPELTLHFWNSNFMDTFPHHLIIEAILAVIVLFLVSILFRSNRKILLLFFAATIGAWLFYYIKYFGYIRHHGHLFLIFVLCYWFYSADGSVMRDKLSGMINRYFVTAILVVQFAASCCANAYDIKYPFSNDIPAAKYIQAERLDTLPMVGDADFCVSGIAGILHEDVYYMRPAKWGKYILPDQNWGPFIHFEEKDMLFEVNKIMEERKSDIVVILSYPFRDYKPLKWTLLSTFDSSIMGEDYYLYRVNYIPKNLEVLNSNAEALIGKSQFPEAMKLLEKAIQINPHYGAAYMNLADCYNNGLGNYEKALANIDSAMKYSPRDYKVVFDKGAILYNGGHRKEGVASFKEAIELDPQNINTYLTIGKCDSALKNYDDAITYLKMALIIKPGNKVIKNAITNCNMARNNK